VKKGQEIAQAGKFVDIAGPNTSWNETLFTEVYQISYQTSHLFKWIRENGSGLMHTTVVYHLRPQFMVVQKSKTI